MHLQILWTAECIPPSLFGTEFWTFWPFLGWWKVNWLGHIVSAQGVKIDPERVEAINSIYFPRHNKALQSFFWKIHFLQRFLPNFAELTKHMTKTLGQLSPLLLLAHSLIQGKRLALQLDMLLLLRLDQLLPRELQEIWNCNLLYRINSLIDYLNHWWCYWWWCWIKDCINDCIVYNNWLCYSC